MKNFTIFLSANTISSDADCCDRITIFNERSSHIYMNKIFKWAFVEKNMDTPSARLSGKLSSK